VQRAQLGAIAKRARKNFPGPRTVYGVNGMLICLAINGSVTSIFTPPSDFLALQDFMPLFTLYQDRSIWAQGMFKGNTFRLPILVGDDIYPPSIFLESVIYGRVITGRLKPILR
jgi:hypothetical protein